VASLLERLDRLEDLVLPQAIGERRGYHAHRRSDEHAETTYGARQETLSLLENVQAGNLVSVCRLLHVCYPCV
jgi:hypothetical protein